MPVTLTARPRRGRRGLERERQARQHRDGDRRGLAAAGARRRRGTRRARARAAGQRDARRSSARRRRRRRRAERRPRRAGRPGTGARPGRPAGDEPSAKRSSPLTADRRRDAAHASLAACIVSADDGRRVARRRGRAGRRAGRRARRPGRRSASPSRCPEIRSKRHRRARRVAVARAARRGDGDLALRGHAVQRELPGDQLRERVEPRLGDRRSRCSRRGTAIPVETRVVALRLGADHGQLDAAGAALEHLAVLVDEEVVADVVPPVGVAVVAGDAEHDRRPSPRARSRWSVTVWWTKATCDRRRSRRARAAGPSRRPTRSRVITRGGGPRWAWRRRGGARAPAQALADAAGDGRGRLGAHEAGAQRARAAAQAQLEVVGGAGPAPARCRRRGARAVGGVVARDVQRRPRRSSGPPRRRARTCASARRRAPSAGRSGRSAAARAAPASCASRAPAIEAVSRLAGEVELEQRAPAGEGGGGRLQGDGGEGGGAEPEDLAAGGTTIRHGLSEHHMDRKGPVRCQASRPGGDSRSAEAHCSPDRRRAARRRGRRRRSRAARRGRG